MIIKSDQLVYCVMKLLEFWQNECEIISYTYSVDTYCIKCKCWNWRGEGREGQLKATLGQCLQPFSQKPYLIFDQNLQFSLSVSYLYIINK